jgi:hypothetical protein
MAEVSGWVLDWVLGRVPAADYCDSVVHAGGHIRGSLHTEHCSADRMGHRRTCGHA